DDQCHHAGEHGEGDQDGGNTAARIHTRVRHARLSARTASAMSGSPNTAVPATKVSAPAPFASAMVATVMPPSTSSDALMPASLIIVRTRRILAVAAGR